MPPIILTLALLGALLVFGHVYALRVIVLPKKGESHYEKTMLAEPQRAVQQFRRLAKRIPQFR